MAVLREPAFGMNDFHAPKIMKDTDVLVNTILMILFGRPGFYPSLPTLGIFIKKICQSTQLKCHSLYNALYYQNL